MQRIRRNPTKDEITYTIDAEGQQFIATVAVTCPFPDVGSDGPLRYAGLASPTKKLAIESAATVALKALFPKRPDTALQQVAAPKPMRQQLSNAVMKRLTRPPEKSDIAYDVWPEGGLYVATVLLTADLRKDEGGASLSFTGEGCATKKDAMDSAAEVALEALTSEPV